MFDKRWTGLLIALCFAGALTGCAVIGNRPHPVDTDPAGPIVVVRPVPPPPESREGPAVDPVPDYTGWYVGCSASPTVDPPEAGRTETLTGLPWRMGNSIGAMKIVVTLKNYANYPFGSGPIDAQTIELHLDHERTVTIALPSKNTRPAWTFQNAQGSDPLHRRALVYLPTWPDELYGHIKDVKVTDRQNHSGTVGWADLDAIRVIHNSKHDGVCE